MRLPSSTGNAAFSAHKQLGTIRHYRCNEIPRALWWFLRLGMVHPAADESLFTMGGTAA